MLIPIPAIVTFAGSRQEAEKLVSVVDLGLLEIGRHGQEGRRAVISVQVSGSPILAVTIELAGGKAGCSTHSWPAARASCFRLLTHWARRAASRADCTAGNKRAIRTAMIAMTTSSSISVNARNLCWIHTNRS